MRGDEAEDDTLAGVTSTEEPPAPGKDLVPFRSAVRAWFGISLQTFGGPAGQIAVMQRALVDERRWIGQQRFLHALNYCMLLPGPEAQQLATYIGWLLNGTAGGLVAGILFVLPGVVTMLALSSVYVAYGSTAVVTGMFFGVAPAVLAIVVQALLRIGRRALADGSMVAISVAAFVALFVFSVPFPVIIMAAAVVGWLLGRRRALAVPIAHDATTDEVPPVIPDGALHTEAPGWRRTLRVLVVGLVVWGVPVAITAVLTGADSTLTTEGLFFSGTALVTFGGAYAVLSFVAHQAVTVYGWLGPREMVRGLALAETTPGPLIMVVQFVAFVGAYRSPGSLDPWVAAFLGALLTTWVTFVPCFVFIFLGAPYVERLRGNRALSAALTGVTAAVVGVIAHLAVYFATHTLFRRTVDVDGGPLSMELPDLDSLRPVAAGIAVLAAVLVFRVRWSMLRTLALCAAVGLAAVALPGDLT